MVVYNRESFVTWQLLACVVRREPLAASTWLVILTSLNLILNAALIRMMAPLAVRTAPVPESLRRRQSLKVSLQALAAVPNS